MDAVAASAVGAEVACKRATPLLPHLLRRLFAELPADHGVALAGPPLIGVHRCLRPTWRLIGWENVASLCGRPAGDADMTRERQQILILHLAKPELSERTVAWALYDGSRPPGAQQMQAGDQAEPQYGSVLDAMRDGWRVIQLPTLPTLSSDAEPQPGPLVWEYVLERTAEMEDGDGDQDN
jgi:hypothetical protein